MITNKIKMLGHQPIRMYSEKPMELAKYYRVNNTLNLKVIMVIRDILVCRYIYDNGMKTEDVIYRGSTFWNTPNGFLSDRKEKFYADREIMLKDLNDRKIRRELNG